MIEWRDKIIPDYLHLCYDQRERRKKEARARQVHTAGMQRHQLQETFSQMYAFDQTSQAWLKGQTRLWQRAIQCSASLGHAHYTRDVATGLNCDFLPFSVVLLCQPDGSHTCPEGLPAVAVLWWA